MRRRCTLVAIVAIAASCGDDAVRPPPAEIAAGPVTITTDPLAISVAGTGLDREHFIAVATVSLLDPNRYYDPRDPDALTWHVPERATTITDDGWLVLDDGARLRLVAGPIADDAVIELDASDIDRAVAVQLALPRSPDEPIYGFGECMGGADAAGEIREAQFRVDLDVESSLNEAHVPVPLALWPRRGAGLFIEDRRPGAFDVGARDPGVVTATFLLPDRGPYRAHVFTVPTDAPLELVRRYVALTVPPAVPPRWAFAPMQWRNVHDSSDQVREDANAMRTLGIPGSTMWIDNPWQTAYNTFTFDETRFAGATQLIADLTALGYRVLVWSTPYVNQSGETADDFRYAADRDYFVTDDGGRPIVFPWQNGPGALLDFTRDGVAAWWRERIARATAIGIDGFKLDFGEDVVPELGGSLFHMELAAGDNQVVHGIYQRGYHDAYLGALPPGDGFVITRAGAWGEQDRNTAIWPGDLDPDFTIHGVDNGEGKVNVGGLPAAIAAGLSLSVSGYPFYGSDIGGFRGGIPSSEALIRWSQYAALGTIMQLGGGGEHHNPWDAALYDPAALAVYLEYSRLHMDLNPYLWTLALAAGVDGTPVTRPVRFAHACACDDAMFTLGDAILVAPVIEAGATTREVVLPIGEWIDWWTGEVAIGDDTTARTVAAPLDRMPIWQRRGTIVPMFARAADTLEPATAPAVTSYVDPAYGRELRLRTVGRGAVELHDGGLGSVVDVDGDVELTFAPGSEYDIVTYDLIDGAPIVSTIEHGSPAQALPVAVDAAALAACPSPGCWLAETSRLRVRVFAGDVASARVRH